MIDEEKMYRVIVIPKRSIISVILLPWLVGVWNLKLKRFTIRMDGRNRMTEGAPRSSKCVTRKIRRTLFWRPSFTPYECENHKTRPDLFGNQDKKHWLVEEETLNELSRNNTSTTLNEKARTEAKFEAQIKKFSGETTTKKQLTRSVDPVLVKKNL